MDNTEMKRRAKEIESCMDYVATTLQKGSRQNRLTDAQRDDDDWDRRRKTVDPMMQQQLRDISGTAQTNERLIEKLIERDERR